LLVGDSQLSATSQDRITNVLEDEVNLLHLSEKKSSNIVHGEGEEEADEDEELPDVADLSPEARGAIHEKRICDLAARMTLAVLGNALPKSFAQTLHRYKGKLGQSYDKIILELGGMVEKPVVKKADPVAAEPVVTGDVIEVASEMDDS